MPLVFPPYEPDGQEREEWLSGLRRACGENLEGIAEDAIAYMTVRITGATRAAIPESNFIVDAMRLIMYELVGTLEQDTTLINRFLAIMEKYLDAMTDLKNRLLSQGVDAKALN